MNLDVPGELIIEGVARAFTGFLEAHPDLAERLLTRMAELRCEVLTPAEAAELISLTKQTLRDNFVEYGFDKSTALGPNEPRYFRSQIVGALQREGKVIRGRGARVAKAAGQVRASITPFPRRQAPTLTPAKAG